MLNLIAKEVLLIAAFNGRLNIMGCMLCPRKCDIDRRSAKGFCGSEAVLEMYEQVGPPVLDENGVIKKGLMIRHLILPGLVCDSIKIVEWISLNLPKDVYISLMSQYTPHFEAWRHPEINRKLTSAEYDKVAGRMLELGLTNGYFQNRSSASAEYIPRFR